ncbi:hypothetical protein GA0115254_10938 [Streptomyces sp. Ncost-T10-10d]|nr:hypothetical protein GA0115254_10938 [Streptomyces sp. Ncost-T10-10d]
MAPTTHTHVGRARLPRPAPGGATTVPGEQRPSRSAAGSDESAWPTDTQVWTWAQSVTLLGYGPPPSSFL